MTPEIASRLHPIWKDPAAVRVQLADWVSEADFESDMSFRRLHPRVFARWAAANGYTDEHGCIDWHLLRASEPLLQR